ncbi:hypothetical protein [Rhodococcus ruber]|uniref:hypothetical protein n=1 Tax=Rhodococcus ruber TaxID=1830 RepID=UPI000C79D072|nr:hypothetical protein [Rhodococcus ruber]AUM20265.1 hypothetical protein CSW53_27250 [Rhodococcus ruber]
MTGATVPPTELRIELLAPTVLGVASSDPLDVDLEVTTDPFGLPYLQRHRLSARLRDAALAASLAYPDILVPALDLLGAARGLGAGRRLQIGHARLPIAVQAAAAHAVHSEHASTGHEEIPRPLISRIRDAYTETLTSTALDDDAAPVTGTRRQVRAVRKGTVLSAPLLFTEEPPSPDHVWALALMCTAVEQIGSGAARGLGQVCCSLDGDRDRTHDLAFRTGA